MYIVLRTRYGFGAPSVVAFATAGAWAAAEDAAAPASSANSLSATRGGAMRSYMAHAELFQAATVTKGGMQMKGLFTKYPIQACEFVGFFTGSWYIPPLCTRQSRAASAPMRAAATLAALLVSRRL